MKEVDAFELVNLMGGTNQHGINCADLQNFATKHGHTFTNEQWDRWIDAWETYCVN